MSTARYPDRAYFARVASESRFQAEPLETVFRLVDLMSRLTREMGSEILLRGGTALNLLYLDMPRLSVDIDLDFVGAKGSAEAQRRRPEILRQIEEVGSRARYEVKPERQSYAMSHQLMHYTNASGLRRFLRVDVNFLDRVPVLAPQTQILKHSFGDDLPTVEVQSFGLEELAASKLIALVRRAAARDLFDVAMLADLGELDMETFKTLLVVRGASYPPPGPDAYDVKAADVVKPQGWRSEVMSLARRPLPIDLARARELAGGLLGEISELRDHHRDFLRGLDDGEIRADVLSLSDKSRVLNNPGLLWRLKVGVRALEER